MARPPFTVGLVQDAAGSDRAANLANSIAAIREAHRRGAQIICLKELFNAPYFAKSQRHDRFDIAEPIPGPTTNAVAKIGPASGMGRPKISPLSVMINLSRQLASGSRAARW